MDRQTALRLVRGKPWHHDFEIVPGVRTRGTYDPSALWDDLRLPEDLSGVALADVGASNGYFSFEARRRGARVVAFDFRHKDNSGFGLAQSINGIDDIEHHQVNVLELDAARFGGFDVVLALGLLYHTADPYRALANCAALSRQRLLIESYCIDAEVPAALRDEPVMRLIPDAQRFPTRQRFAPDRSNFWGFTTACLRGMAADVGFATHRVVVRTDRVVLDCQREVDEPATRLGIAYGRVARVPVGDDVDDPASWTVF